VDWRGYYVDPATAGNAHRTGYQGNDTGHKGAFWGQAGSDKIAFFQKLGNFLLEICDLGVDFLKN